MTHLVYQYNNMDDNGQAYEVLCTNYNDVFKNVQKSLDSRQFKHVTGGMNLKNLHHCVSANIHDASEYAEYDNDLAPESCRDNQKSSGSFEIFTGTRTLWFSVDFITKKIKG